MIDKDGFNQILRMIMTMLESGSDSQHLIVFAKTHAGTAWVDNKTELQLIAQQWEKYLQTDYIGDWNEQNARGKSVNTRSLFSIMGDDPKLLPTYKQEFVSIAQENNWTPLQIDCIQIIFDTTISLYYEYCKFYLYYTVTTSQRNKVYEYIDEYIDKIKGEQETFKREIQTQKNESIKSVRDEIDAKIKESKKTLSKAIINANYAAKKVKDKVAKETRGIPEKVTESSVMILGLFAAIVLALIGTAFFSESLLDHIAEASAWKLISTGCVIGLVGGGILWSLYRFIIRVGAIDKKTHPSSKADIIVPCVVVVALFIGAFLGAFFDCQHQSDNADADTSTPTIAESEVSTENSIADETENEPSAEADSSIASEENTIENESGQDSVSTEESSEQPASSPVESQ